MRSPSSLLALRGAPNSGEVFISYSLCMDAISFVCGMVLAWTLTLLINVVFIPTILEWKDAREEKNKPDFLKEIEEQHKKNGLTLEEIRAQYV